MRMRDSTKLGQEIIKGILFKEKKLKDIVEARSNDNITMYKKHRETKRRESQLGCMQPTHLNFTKREIQQNVEYNLRLR